MEKQYLVGMEQLIPWAMSMNVLKTAADAKKERELQRQSETTVNLHIATISRWVFAICKEIASYTISEV